MDQDPALRARWRRDLHSFVAMVIAGIAVTALAGIIIPTRYTWIASPEELDHAISRDAPARHRRDDRDGHRVVLVPVPRVGP